MDEAESGRIADHPEFRKMIDAAAKTNAPFQEILVWKFTRKREHTVAYNSLAFTPSVPLELSFFTITHLNEKSTNYQWLEYDYL